MKNKIILLGLIGFMNLSIGQQSPTTPTLLNILNGSGDEDLRSIIQTSDGNYIIAGTSNSDDDDFADSNGENDAFVFKITSTGTLLWQKFYGGSSEDHLRNIISTPDGGFLITGYTTSTDGNFSLNQGEADGFAIKISSTGDVLWQKTYGGIDNDILRNVFINSDGSYTLVGNSISYDNNDYEQFNIWVLKVNADTGEILTNNILIFDNNYNSSPFTSATKINDNGLLFVGDTWNESAETYIPYILKVDSNNNLVFYTELPSDIYGDGGIDDVVELEDGTLVCSVGNTNENGSHLNRIVKFDSNGVYTSATTFETAASDEDTNYYLKILKTDDNGYLLTGAKYAGNIDDQDIIITKLSSTGVVEGNTVYGGTGYQYISNYNTPHIIQNSNGNYVFVGNNITQPLTGKALGLNDSNGIIAEFSLTTLGTKDNEYSTFSIYPNPVQNEININNPLNQSIDSVSISDISGKVIFKMDTITNNNIDVNALQQGVYILNIVSNNTNSYYKFIKR